MEVARDDLMILCVVINKVFNFYFECVFKLCKKFNPNGIMAEPTHERVFSA